MRVERAEYGATEPMFHPRVIILPGVTWGHRVGRRQDVSIKKASKENGAQISERTEKEEQVMRILAEGGEQVRGRGRRKRRESIAYRQRRPDTRRWLTSLLSFTSCHLSHEAIRTLCLFVPHWLIPLFNYSGFISRKHLFSKQQNQ